jgi:hypothetical protein
VIYLIYLIYLSSLAPFALFAAPKGYPQGMTWQPSAKLHQEQTAN